ncbi:zonular occludens toxin family protein [Gilvimarinus japonicus]|uniref:Zonular occludens toxin family protein n=1 Tax=Gilvimarinus japonicus TaxID=1796469 RepID=A0ABV7HSK0_9GAMM
MTAVIHHGPPGSYKTFALVQRVIIPELIKGRTVVTNVRGVELDAIAAQYGVELPEQSRLIYVEPDIAGYKHMARFFHWVPLGALIVMDEGQRVYPTRERSLSHLDQATDNVFSDESGTVQTDDDGNHIFRPYNIENALDQHRHYNWDIYISTTNIGKINGEIRKVVEWSYRHRNNSGLLPWYKNTWTEFRHDAEQSGKSISHYSGTPKKYKADPKAFACYKSTATGKAKESSENISVFRDPKVRMLLGLLICAGVYISVVGYQKYQDVQARINPDKSKAVENGQDVSLVRPENDRAGTGMGNRVLNAQPSGSLGPRLSGVDLIASGAKLYFTGSVNRKLWFSLVLCDEGPACEIPLKSDDLELVGYDVLRRSQSFVKLVHTETGRIVIASHKPADTRLYTPPERSRNSNQQSPNFQFVSPEGDVFKPVPL